MSRAPYVMSKADSAFARDVQMFDTTIGWRFVNSLMKKQYGIDSMPETGENVAEQFRVSRADQDAFALRSQQRALRAQASGVLAEEIAPVTYSVEEGRARRSSARDEHPRETSLEALAKLGDAVSQWRHRDSGQCVGRERRRVRAAARERERRDSATA